LSAAEGAARPAIFLDRDGTIIEDVDYPRCLEDVRLIPGSAEALRDLQQAGFLLIVLTNQSGIARGLLDENRLAELHAHLQELLSKVGSHIDAFYHCPHHPSEGAPPYRADCDCRKPKPGLLRRALAEWSIDLARSYVLGDSPRDLEIARGLPCRRILVRTGKGAAFELAGELGGADRVCDDLAAAVSVIRER